MTLVPLANNWAGLDRMTSPQNLDASKSPDTTDARSYKLHMGALGPRNGRTAQFDLLTLTGGNNFFLGMGTYNAVVQYFRVLAVTSSVLPVTGIDDIVANGFLLTVGMTWPQYPNPGASPSALSGMHSCARWRFLQYKSRYYAFNGRNRMRNLDGTAWQLAGITKPVFTPNPVISDPATITSVKSETITPGSPFSLAVLTIPGHSFVVGQLITVNLSDPAYNGTFAITATTTDTISYNLPAQTTATPMLGTAITSVASAETGAFSQDTAGLFGGCTSCQFTAPNHTLAAGDVVAIQISFVDGSPSTIFGVAVANFATPFDVNVYAVDGASFYAYLPKALSGGTQTNIQVQGTATPTATVGSTGANIVLGAWTSNVVSLTTNVAHGVEVGQLITLYMDAYVPAETKQFSELLTVASVPTTTTLTASPTDVSSSYGDVASNNPVPLLTLYAGGLSSGTLTPVIGPSGDYRYYITASNSKHLDVEGRAIESIPSEISDPTGLTNQSTSIGNIPSTHEDPQVDTWIIYRNKSGEYSSDLTSDQQDFFQIGVVPIGTTSFVDTLQDYQLTGANRLRFDQNIPPTFKYAAIYGERMFGVGFDPITLGTAASVSTDTVKFSDVAISDGAIGAWFRIAGDVDQYRVIKIIDSATIQLDRPYVGTISGNHYALYRYPWEIYYSEFQDVEAWGPDGEGLRFMIQVPGMAAVTGLMEWQGVLLVFTQNQIYAISGKGPTRTDVRMLPDPIFSGLGAVSNDSVVRVDNDVFFMSQRGPCAMVAGAAPQLIGVVLNTDWIDPLTVAELSLACSGTDDKDVYFCIPRPGEILPSKTFRYERYTTTWWEETGLTPTALVRADSDGGVLNRLYALQYSKALILNQGTTDDGGLTGVPTGMWGSSSVTTTGTYVANALRGSMIQLYLGGVNGGLVATRQIISNTTTTITWSTDPMRPYSGVVTAYDYFETGKINWKWVTKTLEVPGQLNRMDRLHVTFDSKQGTGATLLKQDIPDGVELTPVYTATASQKAATLDVCRATRDYAARLSSRSGVIVRHVMAEGIVEASTV